MKRHTSILLLLLPLLSNCSNEGTPFPESEERELKLFDVETVEGTASKAAVTSISSVNLYVTRQDNHEAFSAGTYTYTLSGGAWGCDNAPELNETTVQVYGHYPAFVQPVTNNTSGNHTVPVTIKATDNFAGSNQNDYLYADQGTPVTASQSNRAISLRMKHALAKVSFLIGKSSTVSETLTLTQIEILSATNRLQTGDNGSMRLKDGELNGLVATSSLTLTGNTSLVLSPSQPNVTCLVAPLSATEPVLSFRLTVIIGTQMRTLSFVTKATSALWTAGNHYVYKITVDKMGGSLEGVQIYDWKNDANQNTSIGI